ncbi:proteoglycan 4a isoform X2 [Archocentrus centrarchus]|uniref:proteoglycan 4a isoform X2 n=1 Tax=Archocentrus centrarchus TaxID=63155 RepID=UPI0011EA0821|nr:proteoglycan 4-like isoform X2 [Archocentrus centrarchus]
MMMMISLGLLLAGLGVTCAAGGPGSCGGRCGEVFTRGRQCNCDFSCLQHKDCCQDFEAACTIAQSCQGRCGEIFRRGQRCECDPLCILYNTCCHDYQLHCNATVPVSSQSYRGRFQSAGATASGKHKSQRNRKSSNSESEEYFTGRGRCPQHLGAQCQGALRPLNSLTAGSSGSIPPAVPTNQLQHGVSNMPAGLPPMLVPSSHSGAPYSPAPSSFLPINSAPSLGSGAPVSPLYPGAVGSKLDVQLVLSPGGAAPSVLNQGLSVPAGFRPSTLQDVAQSLVHGGPEGPGTGLFADVDLCSDSPINGLTALINGTMLVFKGKFFWSIDPVSRSVGHPQSITDALGVPSPIDTIFTRANCQGNTYIIKGDQYWRLDGNMMMEPGYPKPLASEFSGLTGSISAALAVPATRSRPETVYFFKNGEILQSFTFPPGSIPSCSKRPRSPMNAGLHLSGEINIKVSLKGFPTPVTSALSMPSLQGSGRYHHYVFTGPLFFNVHVSGDLPVLAEPDPSAALAPLPIVSPAHVATSPANMGGQNAIPPQPANSIRVWLRCP